MIHSIYFDLNSVFHENIPVEQFKQVLQDKAGVLWVDFEGEEPANCETILRDVFSFHPLAIDDALHESHSPKIDDWESYIYLVLHDIGFARSSGELEITELDVFLGPNYMVTSHDMPIQAVERAWKICSKDMRQHKLGADHLLYRLADEVVADYMRTVDIMDDDIEQAEDDVFLKGSRSIVQRIFTLKRATLHLRRSLSPLREVFNKLARDEYAVVDARDQIYFRDIYDHLVRLHDISESLRDLASGVLDTYLSVVNNRMNDIMKTLTIITSLFMPLSFIAGFFGMNFFVPDPPLASWVSLPVFISVLFLCIGLPAAMFWWMKRRDWL